MSSIVYFTVLFVSLRLAWDPREYGELDVIRVPVPEIWKPDMKLYNELVGTAPPPSLKG